MSTSAPADLKQRFTELAIERLPHLYAMARRLVGADAEDAVQDCLVKAYRGFPELVDEKAAPAWFSRILLNCCRDRGRARARGPTNVSLDDEAFSLYRKIADEDPFPYSDSLHMDFVALFDAEDIRQVLASLPDIYRYPLILVHMQGLSVRESAELLESPVGTVLARLHRGRKLFEKRMWEYAEERGLLEENTDG